MKIFVNATTIQDLANAITSSDLAVTVRYYFDDGQRFGGESELAIPWTTTSTPTSLNDALKTATINLIALQQEYTFNPSTDQMFLLAGFTAL